MIPSANIGMGIIIVFLILWLVLILVSILAMIFWIFMIVDAAKRTFKNENDKIVWILVIVLTGIVGALIYYFVVKRADKKKTR